MVRALQLQHKRTVPLCFGERDLAAGFSPLAATLALGVASQLGQVLLLRELLVVFHGNEMALGLILAAWLAWGGLGSRLAAGRAGRTERPRLCLFCLSLAYLFLLPGVLFLTRAWRGFIALPPGAYPSLLDMALASTFLAALPCLVLGGQYVFLARIWRDAAVTGAITGAGKAYAGEAAGNLAGGILFTFFMVRFFDSFQVALAGGLVLLAPFILAPFASWRRVRGSRPAAEALFTAGFFVFLTAVLVFSAGSLERYSTARQWHDFAPGHSLEGVYPSRYGAVAVLRLADQYSYYQSGHLVFSAAGPSAPQAGMEEQEAVHLAHLAMVQHEAPREVLLVGGGMSGLLAEVLRHPVHEVFYLELDEELVAAARPRLHPATAAALADPRVTLLHEDGPYFLQRSTAQYDVIIVDAPDPATAVFNRFYTREFYALCAARLRPGGVLVTGALSTPDLRERAAANRNATIYHTLHSVFPRVLVAGDRFLYFIAGREEAAPSVDAALLARRYEERQLTGAAFSPEHFYHLLEEGSLLRVNQVVRQHGRRPAAHLEGPRPGPIFPPSLAEIKVEEKQLPPPRERFFINSDYRPLGYYYTLMFWEQLTRGGQRGTFAALLRVDQVRGVFFFLLPLAIALFLRLGRSGRRRERGRRLAVHMAVFSTGLSTMAMQVALLFAFQGVYGFVYETVGLIVAIFMAGLALGAVAVNAVVEKFSRCRHLAILQLVNALAALLFAAVLPRAGTLLSPDLVLYLFALLTFTAGLVNGLDFPVAVARYRALGGGPEKAAGSVYGLELAGAACGALLAGVLVAPLSGIAACCLLAALANSMAAVVVLIGGE